MAKILVVAFASQLPGEKGNNRSRFRYVCEYLAAEGHEVVELVSSFRDYDRFQRDVKVEYKTSYKITILPEKGYKKNVSFQRIQSQRNFAKEVKEWLNKQDSFDLVYCCVPTHETALVASDFSKKQKIPFVIDVQDLWPEAMKMVINIKYISDLLFTPMKLQADAVYKSADAIVACSQTYLDRALMVNTKSQRNECVYIGVDLDSFDDNANKTIESISKDDTEIWITYIGMLGLSYDLITLIKSCDNVYKKIGANIHVNIIGTGEQMESLKALSKKCSVPVHLLGWMDHSKVAGYLKKSDVLVNAIKKTGPQSITNKIGDYVSAGVPIINGSPNTEFINLIDEREMGINYEAENVESMTSAILKILNEYSYEQRIDMGRNARQFAEEQFDRKNSYMKIVSLVNQLLQ
jgi:glycosyltransferase involved in cell wall biosynthesis